MDLQRLTGPAGQVGVDHLVQPVPDHVADHADEARGPDRQHGQVQHVLAAVVDEVGGQHHLRARAQITLGVLDGDDPRVLGQLDQGLGGDRDTGAAGDVIQHVRQPGRVGDRGEVGDEAVLLRLVVVRRHHEECVGASPFCLLGKFDGVRGVVGADPGHHRRPVPHRLDDGAQQLVFLGVAGGGRFTGGAADDQAVVAHVVDQVGGEAGRTVGVERTVGRHGCDHRGQHPAERRPGCRSGAARLARGLLGSCHEPNATRRGPATACRPRGRWLRTRG